MSAPRPPTRITLRDCVICEDRPETRPGCYLCDGLGWIPLRVFNLYKQGKINRAEWVAGTDSSARLSRGDWIVVRLAGGPHHGVRMMWPADEPPEAGQELPIPSDADLGSEESSRQDTLFREVVTYVVEGGPAGFRAMYRP